MWHFSIHCELSTVLTQKLVRSEGGKPSKKTISSSFDSIFISSAAEIAIFKFWTNQTLEKKYFLNLQQQDTHAGCCNSLCEVMKCPVYSLLCAG